ncbi:MAG: serine protease [Acidobacteriota bacterium]
MPRIDQQVAKTIVYLYSSYEEAEAGTVSGGSGFLVFVSSKALKGKGYLYVITNKHVIYKNCFFVRVNRKDNKTEIFEIVSDNWEFHPTSDIAIAFILLKDSSSLKYHYFADDMLFTREMIKDFDIGLGEDVYMVGRFVHHAGKIINLPSVRSGIISAMPNPDERIKTEMGNQEAFLIEMRSISGFSGSPVVYDFPMTELLIHVMSKGELNKFSDRKLTPEGFNLRAKTLLLGIDSGNFPLFEKVYKESWENEVKKFDPTNYKAENHSGFSVVIPAWEILDLLNSEIFAMHRRETEKKITDYLDTLKESFESIVRFVSSDPVVIDFISKVLFQQVLVTLASSDPVEIDFFSKEFFQQALEKVIQKNPIHVEEKKETLE